MFPSLEFLGLDVWRLVLCMLAGLFGTQRQRQAHACVAGEIGRAPTQHEKCVYPRAGAKFRLIKTSREDIS
jgi:hypothetical protein